MNYQQKRKMLKEITVQVMFRLSGLQWRTSGLTRHLNQTRQDHQTAKNNCRKAPNKNFGSCADRLEKDADDRQCTQETSRTYENMESWDKSQVDLGTTHKMIPQQRQAQFGNQWNVYRTTAGGSKTRPTRQHPELRHARRARMTYQAEQRATPGQAGSSSTQAQ